MINGISIVICCYNSEQRLPRVLEHLERQESGPQVDWEVLIVDNASRDRTAEVAPQLWKRKDVPLRVVHEPRPGLSNARLTGFAESVFDIISFIDDDNWVESRWIEKVYRIMDSDPGIAVLGGRGEGAFESDPPFWFEKYEAAFAVGSYGKVTGKQEMKHINGAGMSIRRSAWDYLRSNGFEFLLSGRAGKALSSGEDVELCLAFQLAGYDLYYDDELWFYHFMPSGRLNWKYLVKLYGAFGRASPVEHLYRSLLHDRGLKRLKMTSAFLSTTRAFYHYVRILPSMLPTLFRENEGERKILSYVYVREAFLERVRTFFVYPSYVKKIRHADWYRNHKRQKTDDTDPHK